MDIQGERVVIRSTSETDLPDIMDLWNDGNVMKWVGFPEGLGYDQEEMKKWFTMIQMDPKRHHFVVYAEEIGFCGEVYYAVDKMNKRAGLDVKFTHKAQGHGLAIDALDTLIRYVFRSELEVEAVYTGPSEENIAARKLYTRCGLREKPRPADLEEELSYWELRRGD